MTYVVAGVTGHTGKVTAETLLEQKKSVRVIVRDANKGAPWRARGAEVAVASLEDPAALARAFEGASGAYVLVPSNDASPDMRADQDRVTASVASAARTSKLPHLVLLSSVGAQHASGTGPIGGLHAAEQALGGLVGTALTSIRAAYFMDNLKNDLGMLDQGVLQSFLPAEHAFSMVATVDIGKTAARALVEGGGGRRVIELGSMHTTLEAADALARIVGRAVKVDVAPEDVIVPALTGVGFSEGTARLYREMFEGILSGRVAFEGGHITVEGTTSLETVLRDLLADAR